jgi:hypothetical protein
MKLNAPKPYSSPKLVTLALATLALAGQSSQAQVVATDGFNYTSGTAIAGSGAAGSGWNAAWTGTVATNATLSLNYSDGANSLATSGGSLVIGTTGAGGTPNRTFSSTFGASGAANTAAAGTLWVSVLYQDLGPTTGGLYRQANVGLFQGTSEYLDVGLPNISAANQATVNPVFSLWGAGKGNINSAFSSTAPAVQTSVSVFGSTPTLIVMKLTLDNVATTSDRIQIWFDPTLGTDPSTTTAAIDFSGQDLTGINNIRLQAGNNNATFGGAALFQADEINVGDTAADVMPEALAPEPGVLSLMALSAATLTYMVHRKKRA